jgi:AraC-like DNA-binding protein
MNRIHEIRRTTILRIERFDHPADCEHVDPAEEEASGFAINIIEAGSLRLVTRRSAWLATPGTAFCTAPGFVYRCEHPAGPTDSCLTVSFGPGTDDAIFRSSSWPAGRLCPPTNRRAYATERLLSRLGATPLEIESAAFELLATVADAGVPRRLYRATQLTWYARRIDRTREKLDTEYIEDHSLDSLARDAGMSPFHFARVFRELSGIPPHRYLVERRLDHAAGLLRGGSSVTEACYASGFSSLSHFVRSFGRRYGAAPSKLWRL